MKDTRIRIMTFIGLITVVFLQTLWLYNTYNLVRENIEEKSNALILDATERELFTRIVSIGLPEGFEISINEAPTAGEYISRVAHSQNIHEALLEYNSKVSLTNLDSIYSNLLKDEGIETQSAIYIINKNDSILESSKELELPWFGTIEMKKLPIRADNSLFIQAVIINPYQTIFEQMSMLFAATVIMMFYVGFCITRQIMVIKKQNKIARIREDFSHAMIHDMKSPITSISVSSHILQSGKLIDDPGRAKRHLDIIHDESLHLMTLADRVLNVAKMEQSKFQPIKQTVDLRVMIEDLIEKFESKANKKITFLTIYETEKAHAEYEYLKEALSNLIDNAVKYSNEKVEIRISCYTEDHCTIIKVKDDGWGIAQKDQTKIFEKFERANVLGRTRHGGPTGFGLGLNYVQHVIKAHGGKILLHSVEGQFTEFTIKIPVLIEEI